MTPTLMLWLKLVCAVYGVDESFALRVAKVESGTKTQEFRLGRLGKSPFYGPMGIRGRYVKGLDMEDPYANILVGVMALGKWLEKTGGNHRSALIIYHGKPCPEHYLRAILD